ncbi:MAG TPA: hypothetical protein VNL92_01900, partial [Dehalococcoidia bacterium]|nr:hypothetical protein [Dehalococcoidia bacterium]
ELQGRVFAMQGVLSSLGALAPLLLGGALAELLGVRAVIIGIGVVAAAVGLYTRLGERVNARRSREEGGAGFEEAYR